MPVTRLPALVLLCLSAACATPASQPAAAGGVRSTRSPDLITHAEITAQSAGNAHELVTRLRPSWLRNAGVSSIGGGVSRMQYTVVYMDDVRLGGIESLRTVSAYGITSIRLLNAERAMSTLPGAAREPINGAIVISTK